MMGMEHSDIDRVRKHTLLQSSTRVRAQDHCGEHHAQLEATHLDGDLDRWQSLNNPVASEKSEEIVGIASHPRVATMGEWAQTLYALGLTEYYNGMNYVM